MNRPRERDIGKPEQTHSKGFGRPSFCHYSKRRRNFKHALFLTSYKDVTQINIQSASLEHFKGEWHDGRQLMDPSKRSFSVKISLQAGKAYRTSPMRMSWGSQFEEKHFLTSYTTFGYLLADGNTHK